ncbi:shikimate dehydrogenase [Lewinellaceae bacterium SD302]|nr:shikimate dehydrogenase [Lewinellaceae bacterium SD302]
MYNRPVKLVVLPMLFGLIGYPISKSFSRPYFTEKFKEMRLNNTHEYRNFELQDLSLFPEIIEVHPELRGLNVTIPHKQAVMQYLDEIDPAAELIGAVNTILVKNGKTKGFNTDLIGFQKDFSDFIGYQSSHVVRLSGSGGGPDYKVTASAGIQPDNPFRKAVDRRAMVLGTGGASLAIREALRQLEIPTTLVSRSPGPDRITYEQIDANVMEVHRYLINCTPLGSIYRQDECPALPYQKMNEKHFCYDLVYNPTETLFLRHARNEGAQTRNGIGMLREQAEAAWEIWS